MSQLFVLPHPAPTPQAEFAYVLAAAAGPTLRQGMASAALLPKAQQCYLVVPATGMAWHAASMPKLPRATPASKVSAAVAAVLEEQLLDDPAQLHLAACPALRTGSSWWVAACNKSLLHTWLGELREAGQSVVGILPQTAPGLPASVHVSGTPEHAIVHVSDEQGAVSVPLAMAQPFVSPDHRADTTAEPAVAGLAQAQWGHSVPMVPAHEWLLQCGRRAIERSWSLAMGEFELGGGGRLRRRLADLWQSVVRSPAHRPLRWGVLSLVLVQLIGLNMLAWKESQALAQQRAQMSRVLTTSFPGVKLVVDAPLQMHREVMRLRQSQGQLSERDFESIYGRFLSVAALPNVPDSLEYASGELSLSGHGLLDSQLDDLLPRLRLAGIEARRSGAALVLSHKSASGAAR